MAHMAKAVVRIPLDVPPELADSLDRAVGLLQVETGQRQTRTSFIKLAVQAEISRLEGRYADLMPRPISPATAEVAPAPAKPRATKQKSA